MIFKRREKRPFKDLLREMIAPRKGWRRGFKYIGRRVQRLPDTPHRIALGFACGALASFSPFFTLHALVAALLAWAVRGNVLAGVFGTVVGNPISFPFIATVCLQTGGWLTGRDLGAEAMEKFSFSYIGERPLDFLEGIFTPYLLGGIGPGLLCGLGFYLLLRPMVAGFQKRRRDALAQRARDLVGSRAAGAARRKGGGTGSGSGSGDGVGGGGSEGLSADILERGMIGAAGLGGASALPHAPRGEFG